MGDFSRINFVAQRILASIQDLRAQNSAEKIGLVVVVSAMSGKTDELISAAKFFSKNPNPKELDMLLSSGERVSAALLAMAIQELGGAAISLSGAEAGVITDNFHTRARILNIDTKNIKSLLRDGKIVVVAGFQGISMNSEITTLGRGGSDLSAVALASALACPCEIYSDVDGIYTTDPRIVPMAKKIPQISYDEMLELASLGAKVLQSRSVEFAKKHGVKIIAKSSFTNDAGTQIVDEENVMEKPIIRGIALDKSEALLSLKDLPSRPGIAAKVFKKLADFAINVDMIVQNVDKNGRTNLDFTAPLTSLHDVKTALKILETEILHADPKTPAFSFDIRENIAKVSIVGLGMKSHFGVASTAFTALAEENINIFLISTSEIKISMIVDLPDAEAAIIALHAAYALDK